MTNNEIPLPLRQDEARRVIASVDDSVTANLLQLCLARMLMRHARAEGVTEMQFRSQLPVAPIDMEFVVSALKEVFSNRQLLEKIMQGQSIAAATGWDV